MVTILNPSHVLTRFGLRPAAVGACTAAVVAVGSLAYLAADDGGGEVEAYHLQSLTNHGAQTAQDDAPGNRSASTYEVSNAGSDAGVPMASSERPVLPVVTLASQFGKTDRSTTSTQKATTTQAPTSTTAAPPPPKAVKAAPAETAAEQPTTTANPQTTTEAPVTAPEDSSTTEPSEATSTTAAPEETTSTTATTEPTTTTAAPETTTTAPADNGWVDSGNGVMMPPVLLRIRHCESTDNYKAANRYSSARGAYQFLTGSWDWYGHADRYGVKQAHLATPAQQDEAARITWEKDGTRPWNASKRCWG